MRELDRLLQAVRVGDLDSVRGLLAEDPSLINQRNQLGQGAVMLAKYHRQPKALALLLEHGPELNLHEAAAKHMGIVRSLVEAGADVNAPQQQGFTPLHAAAQNGDEEMVRFLLSRQARLDARSANGQSPLDMAMTHGHGAVVKLLERVAP